MLAIFKVIFCAMCQWWQLPGRVLTLMAPARQLIWENRLFLVVNDGDAVVFDSFLIVEHRISSKPCLGPALHYTPDRIFSILLLSRPAIAVTLITLKSSNLRKCNEWTLWKGMIVSLGNCISKITDWNHLMCALCGTTITTYYVLFM